MWSSRAIGGLEVILLLIVGQVGLKVGLGSVVVIVVEHVCKRRQCQVVEVRELDFRAETLDT